MVKEMDRQPIVSSPDLLKNKLQFWMPFIGIPILGKRQKRLQLQSALLKQGV
jgi:hypothetical protein